MTATPSLDAVVRRARIGEPVRDADFFEVALLADRMPAALPVAEPLRALLAPGRRNDGFYLDDAFAEPLRGARAAFVRAEADAESERRSIAGRVRETYGIDATSDEFVALPESYDAPLPDGVAVVRETPHCRILAIVVDRTPVDAAWSALRRAEDDARRALAEGIVRIVDGRS